MEKRCSFAFMTLNSMLCHHMLICVGAVDFFFQNCVNGVYPLILTVNPASFSIFFFCLHTTNKSASQKFKESKAEE